MNEELLDKDHELEMENRLLNEDLTNHKEEVKLLREDMSRLLKRIREFDSDLEGLIHGVDRSFLL